MMKYLDVLSTSHLMLEKKLDREKRRTQRYFMEANRNAVTYHHQLSALSQVSTYIRLYSFSYRCLPYLRKEGTTKQKINQNEKTHPLRTFFHAGSLFLTRYSFIFCGHAYARKIIVFKTRYHSVLENEIVMEVLAVLIESDNI